MTVRGSTDERATSAHRVGLCAAGVVLLTLCGCALDINRERIGMPLRHESFEDLEVGASDLGDSLDALGAPQRVERENDGDETHLWWVHRDVSDINIRFQLPLSFFGYRHNLFQYFQGDDQNNTMHLVFDDAGSLLQKELFIPEEYRREIKDPAPGRVLLTPRAEYAVFLEGDADLDDYRELFGNGYLLGFQVGYQPVAPLIISLGANYQLYEGQRVRTPSTVFEFDDLELFTAEVLVRLQIPFEVFAELFNYAEVRKILLAEDPADYDGWLVYIEAGLGAAFNQDVPVYVNGARQGDFFDDDIGMTETAGLGIEYSVENVSIRLGGTYRSMDAFGDGDTGLRDDAGAFGAWLLGASVSVKL